jgi:hypothetical protein
VTATTKSVHWHCYAYTGKGYTDSEVGKGLAPQTFPPSEISQWLRRKPMQTFTEEQIDDALTWLEGELTTHLPIDAEGFPVKERVAYSRDRLMQRVNRDVVYGYWSVGGQYVSRSMIECNDVGCGYW